MTDPPARVHVTAAGYPMMPRPPLPPGPFLVAGLGRAGRAAALALRGRVGPALVRAWDQDTRAGMQRRRRELESAGIRTSLGPGLTRRDVGWARVVVKSPGIPVSAPVIQRALGKRRQLIDELELGWLMSRTPIVAVTGTNGKSTVCGLTTSVLSAAGYRVQLAGNTQFGPCLSALQAEPLDWIVCEVSSFQLEACAQLLPELAVFTNLTPEHLGRHGSIAQYGAIKRRLFINDGGVVPRAIVDVDAPFGRVLAADVERLGGAVTRVGLSAEADYRVESVHWDLRRAAVRIGTPAGPVTLLGPLPGVYNARNLASALAVADLLGAERRVSVTALSAYAGPPGRFEHIDVGQPFEVIVDFAHTPDALEQLLTTIRTAMRPRGRLHVVFGLGGPPGTAMWEMGRLARDLADRLILTRSGFRGSPPMLALGSILAGARTSGGAELEVILDRREAIHAGVAGGRADDVIVIPGRGALPDMEADPRGIVVPFDDRCVARELLHSLGWSRGGSDGEAGARAPVTDRQAVAVQHASQAE